MESSPSLQLGWIADVRVHDGELVRRARAGDRSAARRLYQRSTSGLIREVTLWLGSAAHAEEIAHEACVTAMLHLDRYDARASFTGWIRGIALNLARKYWRKQARQQRAYVGWEQLHEASPSERDPEAVLCSSMQVHALAAAVDGLSPVLRQAFVLCVVHGLTGREAAARAGTSETNMRVRAARARAVVRSELVRRGWLRQASSVP